MNSFFTIWQFIEAVGKENGNVSSSVRLDAVGFLQALSGRMQCTGNSQIKERGRFKIISSTLQEVNVQINLEFLLVRWIVFVLANLKLSIKEGEGGRPALQ